MVDKKDIINNKHNKRLQKAYSIFDCEAFYSVREALEILQKCSLSAQVKFDESVDVSFNMGVDTKKSDQVVKSFVELSNGNGKKVKILAFADGANIDSALKAGATYAGAEELISDVEQGKIVDFDIEFYFTIGESNGVYITCEMSKLDENFLMSIDKLKKYYEKFKSKWAKVIAGKKKTKIAK